MPRTIEVPDGCKVVIVTDQLIERVRAEADADGWSPARTIQVSIPPQNGLMVDPCFRYVAEVA
jgi:hypothetical protein